MNSAEQSIIQGQSRFIRRWLRYLDLLNHPWDNFMRWLKGLSYNPPRYLEFFGSRGREVYWYPDEAFIELYGELSKGGCQDFIETGTYADDRISYLEFNYGPVLLAIIDADEINLCSKNK